MAGLLPEVAPLAAAPTPDDGRRISGEQPWDEASRPTAPVPDPERLYTPAEQASAQLLLDVHGQLRDELVRLRDLMTQFAHGSTNPAAVRSFFGSC